jgi:small GTP-binding protein
MSKTVNYKGNEYRLELWDTAGQEKYRSLVKSYLKGAHACLYVYDCKSYSFTILDINSYMGLIDWINLFESSNSNNHVSMIAGNKSDICTEEDQEALIKAKSLFKA